jgi:hypothetical protein
MAQFILLLHENPASFADLSPEEIERVIGEYSAWRERLDQQGRMLGSNKLKDEGGKSLSAENGDVRVVDGPFAEAKEVIGGYFVIQAADYAEAVRLSTECPHLRYGGRIELREIHQLEH